MTKKSSSNNNNTIDTDDKDDVLRWAIRYELGLGVSPDPDKARELYAKLDDDNILLKSLNQVDTTNQTGVISDSYKIESKITFDSTIELKKKKEKKEREEREKLKSKMYYYYGSSFLFYIDASEEQMKELKKVINKYNNAIYGCDMYKTISFNKSKSIISVSGSFERYYTDGSFFRELFSSNYNKQKEEEIRKLFIKTCEFCESLKIK